MLTQQYVLFFEEGGDSRFILLQLVSLTKCFFIQNAITDNSSMTTFHHKLLMKEGGVSANG